MSTKIHRVIAEVHRPSLDGPFPGQVEECQYIYENDVVTLTNHDGVPLSNRKNEIYTKTLKPGESPHIAASRLTMQRWRDRGGDKKQFNRPLVYPPTVY